MGNEHNTVMLSILATIVAAFLLFLVTIAVNGGVSATLFMSYVLPLLMSAFTLSVFWAFLFARHKGKLRILPEEEAKDAKDSTPPKST